MAVSDVQGSREVGPAPAVRRARILVVDDSADMRDLLGEVLGSAGYEVIGASSGARALNVMTERRPDLVVTDLLMPGMSGFSLRSAMLRRPELAKVPVIILSAYWRRPRETLEAAEVLPKPLSIDALLASVDRLLRGTHMGDDDAGRDRPGGAPSLAGS